MAIKHLRNKRISIRATDKDVAILKVLSENLKLSQSEVITLALDKLIKEVNK